ncbi:hypothetical protein MRX96_021381 [Rhipicephalus microplus]
MSCLVLGSLQCCVLRNKTWVSVESRPFVDGRRTTLPVAHAKKGALPHRSLHDAAKGRLPPVHVGEAGHAQCARGRRDLERRGEEEEPFCLKRRQNWRRRDEWGSARVDKVAPAGSEPARRRPHMRKKRAPLFKRLRR